MGTCKANLEKDFEFFVKNLPSLKPVEICGIAKILGVALYRHIDKEDVSIEDLKAMSDKEKYELKLKLVVPMDEILEQMMDKFLALNRKRRKEINQILKDAKRGK